jgi:hypothetical protein
LSTTPTHQNARSDLQCLQAQNRPRLRVAHAALNHLGDGFLHGLLEAYLKTFLPGFLPGFLKAFLEACPPGRLEL